MCIGIGNIIPILGYATLDTPVTVVTSGELWNWNWAVSETKTWQLYRAYACCNNDAAQPAARYSMHQAASEK